MEWDEELHYKLDAIEARLEVLMATTAREHDGNEGLATHALVQHADARI